jgi:predicted ATP-grasp superfamily ATP-dependent carboligase
VIAATHSRRASVFAPVRANTLYPPETAPGEFVATLLQYCHKNEIDLIIPGTDASLLPLSEARQQFAGVCQLALPDAPALEIVTNKLKTLQLAEQLAVPVPKTHLVNTVQEARDHAPRLGWPVVLKPQASRIFRNKSGIEAFTVVYAEDLAQLEQQMSRFEGRCPVLLQRYYPGTGMGVELLLHKGRPLAAFQHKRLREIPITGGASAFREGVTLDPTLYEYSVRLLKALNWTGLAMVEFKVGSEGPQLMEINGRVWGSLPLAVRSGMDFPARLVEMYLYGPPANGVPPDSTYSRGLRVRNLELEMLWIASVLRGKRRYPFLEIPKRSSGAKALLELFHPAYKFDILSFDDPRPGLAEVPKIVKKLSKKLKEGLINGNSGDLRTIDNYIGYWYIIFVKSEVID